MYFLFNFRNDANSWKMLTLSELLFVLIAITLKSIESANSSNYDYEKIIHASRDKRDDCVHNEVACDYNAGFLNANVALL